MFDDAMRFSFSRADGSVGRVFLGPHVMITELDGESWLTTSSRAAGEVRHDLTVA